MKISAAGKQRVARLLVEKLGWRAKVSSYFFRKARKNRRRSVARGAGGGAIKKVDFGENKSTIVGKSI